MSTRNTIRLAATCPFRKEALAAVAITPGMVIERTSSSFKPHATDGENLKLKLVAEENDFEGKEITDAYAIGDRVFARVYQPGDEFQGLLAAGESVAINAELISNGAGALRAVTGAEVGDFMAREAVDNSATGTTTSARIHVEVLS